MMINDSLTAAATTADEPLPDHPVSPIRWPVMVAGLLVFWLLRRTGRDRRERDPSPPT